MSNLSLWDVVAIALLVAVLLAAVLVKAALLRQRRIRARRQWVRAWVANNPPGALLTPVGRVEVPSETWKDIAFFQLSRPTDTADLLELANEGSYSQEALYILWAIGYEVRGIHGSYYFELEADEAVPRGYWRPRADKASLAQVA